MSATAFLLMLIGVFVIINSGNFVQVLQNKVKIGFEGTKAFVSEDDRTPSAGSVSANGDPPGTLIGAGG